MKLDSSSKDRDNLLSELKEKKLVAMETEKKLKKAVDEKEKLQAVIRENNDELKAMECSLTGKLWFLKVCKYVSIIENLHTSRKVSKTITSLNTQKVNGTI